MRNSIITKFIAVFLCAASLLGIAGGGASILLLGSAGLIGSKTVADFARENEASNARFAMETIASSWASNQLGDVPDYVTDYRRDDMLDNLYHLDRVYYTITDRSGNEVLSNYNGEPYETSFSDHLNIVTYQKRVPSSVPAGTELPEEDETADLMDAAAPKAAAASVDAEDAGEILSTEGPAPTEAAPVTNKHVYTEGVYIGGLGEWFVYNYTDEHAYNYDVRLYLAEGATVQDSAIPLLRAVASCKQQLPLILGVCALVFAVAAVYLCCAAGHGALTAEVRPGGLNAAPLDLYAGVVLGYLCLCILLADDFARPLVNQSVRFALACAGGLGFVGCLLFVGFCFAFVAQIKAGRGWWWRNSLCGRGVFLFCRLIKLTFTRYLPWCWERAERFALWLSRAAVWVLRLFRRMLDALAGWLGSIARRFLCRAERLFARLPLIWQWLVGGFALIVLLLCGFAGNGFTALCAVAAAIGLVLYGADCFGILLDAVCRMNGGDLEAKIRSSKLIGCFRDFAGELNGLADVAVVAAEKQLKSDRMKTELITNVSHDIKTPLTSIINYVDLLAKPHSPEEEAMYLEVLRRQSGRMKKLIEDLIEMSKATTGNIPVEICAVDAAETVNQALGEFSDKLTAAGLTPVFRCSGEELTMLADGRLMWRAMSNVLSNAVKYAMPGTRLYVDVGEAEGKIFISFKNISRAELNVSADELLERFVRGDTSRNTEGSGLGLNIAKSLMELQKGQLRLLVDGDLFKVTLVFPKA